MSSAEGHKGPYMLSVSPDPREKMSVSGRFNALPAGLVSEWTKVLHGMDGVDPSLSQERVQGEPSVRLDPPSILESLDALAEGDELQLPECFRTHVLRVLEELWREHFGVMDGSHPVTNLYLRKFQANYPENCYMFEFPEEGGVVAQTFAHWLAKQDS